MKFAPLSKLFLAGVSLSLLSVTPASALVLTDGGPDQSVIFERDDGKLYKRDPGQLWSQAAEWADSPVANKDQIRKWRQIGQFWYLVTSTGELLTNNADAASRVSNGTAPRRTAGATVWATMAAGVKDVAIKSRVTSCGTDALHFYALKSDGAVWEGFADPCTTSNSRSWTSITTNALAVAVNGNAVPGSHNDVYVWRNDGYAYTKPSEQSIGEPFTDLYGNFTVSSSGKPKARFRVDMPSQARQTAGSWDNAIGRVDGHYLIFKSGEVLKLNPVLMQSGSIDVTQLAQTFVVDQNDIPKTKVAKWAGVYSGNGSELIDQVVLTTDGQVLFKGTNINCRGGLPNCAASALGWTTTISQDITDMSFGPSGTFVIDSNKVISYAGKANTDGSYAGAVIPSEFVSANGFLYQWFKVGAIKTIPDKVLGVAASDGTSTNAVDLRWDLVPGATTYKIFASNRSGEIGQLVKEVTEGVGRWSTQCSLTECAPCSEYGPVTLPAGADRCTTMEYLKNIHDGSNIYFTVKASAKGVDGPSSNEESGYPNVPIESSTVTIDALYDLSGSARVQFVDRNPNDTYTVTVTSPPANGTLAYDTATRTFTFRPNSGWAGEETFAYRVVDSGNYQIDSTGRVRVQCPNPQIRSMRASPYPALRDGTLAILYDAPACAANLHASVALKDGVVEMGNIVMPGQQGYTALPTGTMKELLIPFKNLLPYHYDAVLRLYDPVKNASDERKFQLSILDLEGADFQPRADRWNVRAFIDPISINVEYTGTQRLCDLTVSATEARGSLAEGSTLKCLIEWTRLPQGVAQRLGSPLPNAHGLVGELGNLPVEFTASIFRDSGETVLVKRVTRTVQSAQPPAPVLAVVPAKEGATMFTVPTSGGVIGKITSDSMAGAGVTTQYTLGGGDPVEWTTPKGIAHRNVELKASPLWSTRPLAVKVWYTAMPEIFTETTVNVVTVPSEKIKVKSVFPETSTDNNGFKVRVSVGIPVPGGLEFDETIHGRWNARIARLNQDGSLAMLTPAVEVTGGTVDIDVQALNVLVGQKLVAVADVASPIEGVAFRITSDPAPVYMVKGSALSGKIAANKVSAPSPALVTLTSRMDSRDDSLAVGATDWFASVDNGASWNPISSPEEAGAGRLIKTFGNGKYLVKARYTNKHTSLTSESNVVEIVAFKVPGLIVDVPTVAFPGTPVTLTATFKPNNAPAAAPIDDTPVVEWEVEGNAERVVGNSVTVESLEKAQIKVVAYARSKSADPKNPDAWSMQRVLVKFIDIEPPKVQIQGSPIVEVGKTYTFTANVVEPWVPARSVQTVQGEWILPDGTRVPGRELRWSPAPGDVSAGDVRTSIQYRAWVAGYEETSTRIAEYRTKVWQYIWPTWDLKVVQDTTYAPSTVKLDLFANDRKLLAQFKSEPLTLAWTFPDRGEVLRTKEGTATIRLPAGGSYPVSIQLSDTRGNSTTVTKELLAVDAPPFEIDIKLTPSNILWREPVSVNIRPDIKGGHPFDRPSSIQFAVNDMPLPSKGAAASGRLESAGTHTVTVTLNSKMGAVQSRTIPVTVVPNQAPTCELVGKDSTTTKTLQVTAVCRDVDGKVVGYRWLVDGESLNATANRISIPYVNVGGAKSVIVEAMDDSGGIGIQSAVFTH